MKMIIRQKILRIVLLGEQIGYDSQGANNCSLTAHVADINIDGEE